MTDMLTDAQEWLDALPQRIGTHWTDCHTDRHHAPCLVRRLMDEIARLRLTDAERQAVECGLGEIEGVYPETAATLRAFLERTK